VSPALDPEVFAEGPARDGRFEVRDVWAELTNLPDDHPDRFREFLHRQMNQEMDGLEICCRNLVDFPDAPWELRMAMARQCWDEVRHIQAFRRALERRGGRVGEFPVMNFQYRMLTRIDSLIGRLAVQNRSFEAAGIDAIQQEVDAARRGGEADLLELFDMQLADELQHVRYANVWVQRLRQEQGPRAVLDLARAVSRVTDALAVVAGPGARALPVAEEIRREAGFGDDEIEAAKRLVASR
jgi:uncharacterized ferritin-like protein (DUF455 family)